MVAEKKEDGIYTICDGEKPLLTITDMGNNVYHAVNINTDITAEIVPIDEYKTKLTCIEYKLCGKDGKFRKTTKFLKDTLLWLDWILQEKGFIRKAKAID